MKINGKDIQAKEGMTVLQVAMAQGIEIPNMCYYEHVDHFASCMLCVVKDTNSQEIFPSCSVNVREEMDLVTNDEELQEMRKSSLELLLSDHVGDCEAPCTLTCPAFMDIPEMNRLLANGDVDEALKIVKANIALPAVLGRICPAPCEKACKRKTIDEPVSICLLKRYAADHSEHIDVCEPSNGKRIAIIGSGPAGLSSAYYLALKGYSCTIFDKNKEAGGNLRYEVPEEKLPKEILDQDIDWIKKVGVEFVQDKTITKDDFNSLQQDYDAVIVALGDSEASIMQWGIDTKKETITTDKQSFQTNIPNVFAVRNVLRSSQYSIRALGHGRIAALSVDQFLNQQEVVGSPRIFNSRFGFLYEEEFPEYLKESVETPRQQHENTYSEGFTKEEMIAEAERCMHCDCRKLDNCKLRDYSDDFDAKQSRFSYGKRKSIKKYMDHEKIVFEPEKCIKCGICVRITEKKKEKLGLTFIGRGFDVEIGIPFNDSLKNALVETELEVAAACPTGALALKK